jgi:hypothetical protein
VVEETFPAQINILEDRHLSLFIEVRRTAFKAGCRAIKLGLFLTMALVFGISGKNANRHKEDMQDNI